MSVYGKTVKVRVTTNCNMKSYLMVECPIFFMKKKYYRTFVVDVSGGTWKVKFQERYGTHLNLRRRHLYLDTRMDGENKRQMQDVGDPLLQCILEELHHTLKRPRVPKGPLALRAALLDSKMMIELESMPKNSLLPKNPIEFTFNNEPWKLVLTTKRTTHPSFRFRKFYINTSGQRGMVRDDLTNVVELFHLLSTVTYEFANACTQEKE